MEDMGCQVHAIRKAIRPDPVTYILSTLDMTMHKSYLCMGCKIVDTLDTPSRFIHALGC